ncbi:MAG: anaerobic ribonucleoside-triphosphate reductase [Candidatus Sericytochromatia bacterium]|nr:anaerobic ribonucleoside-triphosphate reductase [Candidatus Sericytochromatia bacterium]
MAMTAQGVQEVEKRDGRIVAFDRGKIVAAIMKAAQSVQGSDYQLAEDLADRVAEALAAAVGEVVPSVERVQDVIEKVLIEHGHARTAKAFILYRARRSRIREGKSELMETVGDLLTAPARPGPGPHGGDRHQAIGEAACREFYLRRVLDEGAAEAHARGDWHIHGLSRYDQTPHSAVVPLRHLLEQGFAYGRGFLRPARKASALAALTSVVLGAYQAEVHGGTSVPAFDTAWAHLVPADTTVEALAEAVESLLFNLNTASFGAPRASLHVGGDTGHLARLVTTALLHALEATVERGEVTLHPHVVYGLRPGINMQPGDPNFDLTQQALRVARLTPAVTFLHDEPGVSLVGHAARLAPSLPDGGGLGLVARLSLNLPRVVLRARREGFETNTLLGHLVDEAVQELSRRRDALLRRPARDFPLLAGALLPGRTSREQGSLGDVAATPRVALNLVGFSEMLVVLGGSALEVSPSAQAEAFNLFKQATQRGAEVSAQLGLTVDWQAMAAPAAAERFSRLDRREFGIIRGVTDQRAYGAGLPWPGASEANGQAHDAGLLGCGALLAGGALVSGEAPRPAEEDGPPSWLEAGLRAGASILAARTTLTACQGCGVVRRGGAPQPCSHCGADESRQRPTLAPHEDVESEA